MKNFVYIHLFNNKLVHKIFKVWYFPTGDFLSAKLGHRPSYAWRSILSAQSIVQNGYQWQVGNGESIRVWHDKWFPTPSTFKITSPPVGLPLDAQVSTLINHLNKCWHTNLIRQAFSSKDATTILGIPLSSRLLVDHLIWVYTPKGKFTVRSAYKVALSITTGPSPKTSSEQQRGAF